MVYYLGYLSVLFAIFALVAPAPRPEDIYDQRQNGTENYRINVDGLLLAVAPADAALEAASAADLEELLGLTDYGDLSLASILAQANSTKPSTSTEKPAEPKKNSGHPRLKLRLGNLLLPLLKKTHQN